MGRALAVFAEFDYGSIYRHHFRLSEDPAHAGPSHSRRGRPFEVRRPRRPCMPTTTSGGLAVVTVLSVASSWSRWSHPGPAGAGSAADSSTGTKGATGPVPADSSPARRRIPCPTRAVRTVATGLDPVWAMAFLPTAARW